MKNKGRIEPINWKESKKIAKRVEAHCIRESIGEFSKFDKSEILKPGDVLILARNHLALLHRTGKV